jgi:hypothetical protein
MSGITEHQIDMYRTKAPFGWAASGSTLFAWDDAEHTKWHAVYDLDSRANRNLHREQADVALIAELLNLIDIPNG